MRDKRASILTAAIIAVTAIMIAVKSYGSITAPLVVVEGNSMLPTLYSGDLVVIYKPRPQDIRMGDIVVYRSPLTGRLVIHRVIEINKCDNSYCYITKGDNNLHPDNSPVLALEPSTGIPYKDVVGVVIGIRKGGSTAPLRIPYLGILTMMTRG